LLNDSVNQFKEIYVFDGGRDELQNNLIFVSFADIYNNKLNKRRFNMFNFYKSSYLITLNNILHLNCLQTIEFMKRRIHFNLFSNQQIEQFFLNCKRLEFDF
jgi:hypothetical protein